MGKFRFCCVLIVASLFLGCAKPDENFIGKWSNQQANGLGDMRMTITRDGDKLLVKQNIISNGALLSTQLARVEDGYLLIDGEVLFKKISYSQSEDLLIPFSLLGPVATFHREK